MHPWEKEKTIEQPKIKKEKRNVRQKLGLAAHAVTLSFIACSVIYGSLLYEATKFIVVPGHKNKV